MSQSSIAGLRTLRTGLLVYGAIGLLLAVVAIVVAVGMSARTTTAAQDVDTRIQAVARTMESAADTLERASGPVGSTGLAAGSVVPALDSVAGTLDSLELTARGVAQQIESFEILGQKPLAAIAAPINSLSDSLAGAGDSVAAIATQIRNQGDALQETGEAMARLAVDLRDTAEVLRGGLVGDAMRTFASVVLAFVLMVALFFGFTAAGTLIAGTWLHRWIASETHVLVPAAQPVAPLAEAVPPAPPAPAEAPAPADAPVHPAEAPAPPEPPAQPST